MLRLEEVPGAVDDVLRRFLDAAAPALAEIGPPVAEVGGMLAEFVLGGGKRVRPLFVFAGWQCAGGPAADGETDPALTLRVCAAIELIQACALIHDDVIDRSGTRRGRPTVHRRSAAGHESRGWSGDAGHFGVSVAILAGDLALAWADDLVHGIVPAGPAGQGPAGAPLPRGATARWAQMRTEVLGGQLLDIVNEASGDETPAAAYRVMEYKTAAYTVARPLQLGAALAEGSAPGVNGAPAANAELAGALGRIGTDLGIAFQLRDDILGVFGDPAQTGKPSGDDLISGKRTALLAAGLQRADAAGDGSGAWLRGAVGRDLSGDELTRARDLLTSSGALAEIEDAVTLRLDRALAGIAALPASRESRDDLTALAHRITHRTR